MAVVRKSLAVRPSELRGSHRIATEPAGGGTFPADPPAGDRPDLGTVELGHEVVVVLGALTLMVSVQWVFVGCMGG